MAADVLGRPAAFVHRPRSPGHLQRAGPKGTRPYVLFQSKISRKAQQCRLAIDLTKPTNVEMTALSQRMLSLDDLPPLNASRRCFGTGGESQAKVWQLQSVNGGSR